MNPIRLASEDGAREVWACGVCETLTGRGTQAQAIACCICSRCGGKVDKRYERLCDACKEIESAERIAKRDAALLALPVVEYDGGPVYVNDTYYDSLEAACEAIWDDGPADDTDHSNVIIHPCTVGKAGTRDIAETIDEGWAENFDDWDPGIPEPLLTKIQALQLEVEAAAPTVWNAISTKRLAYVPPTV